MSMEFDRIWTQIVLLEGEPFYQKGGKLFTYSILGATVRPDTTNRALTRSQFKKAWERRPLDGPGALQDLQGPSYLWAILTDTRVSG